MENTSRDEDFLSSMGGLWLLGKFKSETTQQGWRDGSLMRSTWYSSQKLDFSSQHQLQGV